MWGRGVMVLLVLVFVVGACSDLETLEPGLCGNGVLERGEDCDLHADPALGPGVACASPSSPTQACRYVCDSGAGISCPAGWACRPDGVCHHATGAFELLPGARLSPAPVDFQLADLDGDGASDVLGVAAAELHAWFADRGVLGDELRRPLPLGSRGAPAFTDVDGDGRADVVAPTPRGLVVLRGTARRALEPVAYSQYPTNAEWIVPLRAHSVAPEHSLLLASSEPGSVRFELVFTRGPEFGGDSRLATAQTVDELHDRLPVADLDGDLDDEVLLAFEGDKELRIASTHRDFFDGSIFLAPRDRTVALGRPIARGGLFGDLDGDGATDLLVSVRGEPAGEGALRCLSDGAGGFEPPAADGRFDVLGWPLAVGDLDGVPTPDGVADFVLASGIYRARGVDDALRLVVDTEGGLWKEAVVADLTGDGLPDVVATEAGEPVLHVAFSSGRQDLWNPRDVPTGGPPSLLRVGDFDGDTVADVAYRAGDDDLEVLFGRDSPLPSDPVLVSRIGGILRLETGALRDLRELPNGISDLVVLAAPDGGRPAAAAFEGATTQILDSPFLLGVWPWDRPRAVVVGRLVPPLAGAEAARDVLAVAESQSTLTEPAVWLLRGAAGARFDLTASVRDDPGTAVRPLLGGECALWAAGDVDADGLDEAVALVPRAGCSANLPASAAPALLVVDASAPEGGGPPTLEVHEQEGAAPLASHGIQLRDLDGDGAADLLIEHDAGVDVLWGGEGGLELRVSMALPAPPGAGAVVSATPLQADVDPALELAVLTEDGEVWIAERTAHAFTYEPAPVARVEGARLRAADLDGDRLDDLCVASGAAYDVLRAVSHLTAR